jgi:hypothetical protein
MPVVIERGRSLIGKLDQEGSGLILEPVRALLKAPDILSAISS